MKEAFKEFPLQWGYGYILACPHKAEYYHRGLNLVPQESSHFKGRDGKGVPSDGS